MTNEIKNTVNGQQIETDDTNEYAVDICWNMEKMSDDELKSTFTEIYDLYHKYDEPENLNRTAEHFRIQIDMIENYCKHMRGFTNFEKCE
jgi:hypothetical protein